jgi:ATP-dependent RNA helicase SUPV3L1/SUV3
VEDLISTLPPEARRILSRAGVRFGALDLFTPQLLKPESTRWRLALWSVARGQPMSDSPAAGAATLDVRTQASADHALKISGFREVGDQAVRIDLIERVAEAAHSAREGRRPFLLDNSLAVSIGCRPRTLSRLMTILGFREQTEEGGAPSYVWRGPRRQARQRPQRPSASPFAVLAELGVQSG